MPSRRGREGPRPGPPDGCGTGLGRRPSQGQAITSQPVRSPPTRKTLPDKGSRPVFGGDQRFAGPLFHDNLLFYEYFHGDNGAGLGASHQTGWTGLIAPLIQLFGELDAAQYLSTGKVVNKRSPEPDLVSR